MKTFLLSCIIFGWTMSGLGATLIPNYSMQNYDRTIQHIYQNSQINTSNISERINVISELFLERPYLNDALGEGKNAPFDEHPLYRTDVFDCVTYVSTVLALAESNNLTEFKQNMLKIQYRRAIPTFVNRLHFTGLDWNTVNAQNGFIRDITASFKDTHGKPIAKTAETLINKPGWYRKMNATRLYLLHPLSPQQEKHRLAALQDLAEQVHSEKSRVLYLPLTILFNTQGKPNMFIFNQIPAGAIIEIVRPNWNLDSLIGTHLNISHLGFAIHKPEGLVFREASSLEHRVVDVPLISYLKGYRNSTSVKGINVQIVLSHEQ